MIIDALALRSHIGEWLLPRLLFALQASRQSSVCPRVDGADRTTCVRHAAAALRTRTWLEGLVAHPVKPNSGGGVELRGRLARRCRALREGLGTSLARVPLQCNSHGQ